MFSDCWGSCQLCGLHLCTGCTRHSSWCIKYNHKVCMWRHCSVTHFCLVWLVIFSRTNLSFSLIRSAVLAHFLLKEKLKKMGVLGCVSCIVGSVVIVIHAPKEQTPSSVEEIWILATQPGSSLSLSLSLSHYAFCVVVYLRNTIFLSCAWNSFSDLRSHNNVDCPCFNSALWTSVRPNKHSGLYRNLFANGCSHSKLLHLSILDLLLSSVSIFLRTHSSWNFLLLVSLIRLWA